MPDLIKMDVNEAKDGLRKLKKQLIDDSLFDREKRDYYVSAIRTSLLALMNYERLLEQTIDDARIQIIKLDHSINMTSLRYRIATEGGALEKKG